MTLGSSHMGIGWMTGWYFGAPCWFRNLRRSYSSYYSKLFNIPITKPHWRIRITLVKWWWTTRDGRRQTQYYVDVYAPDPSDVVLCNPFKWDILWFILVKNLVICVPSTTADCNLFNNHRNKKVVGGNYNVLVYDKNAFAPNPSGVVLWNLFK